MATSQTLPGKLSAEKRQGYEKDSKRAMESEEEYSYQVELFVYDLTRGLARTLSPALLGKQIEGVWHTGVVAYGREYFFGSAGIESCSPGGTVLGEPDRIEVLGESQVPYQLFLEYIFGLGESAYRPGAYELLSHNCNNFTDDISQFLCGRGIPKSILSLPQEVLNTPLGQELNSLLKKADLKHAHSRSINFGPLQRLRPGLPPLELRRTSYEDPEFDALNDAIDRIRFNSVALEERRNSINDKLSKKERRGKRREKKEKKEKKRQVRLAKGLPPRSSSKSRKSKPPLPNSDQNLEEPNSEKQSLPHPTKSLEEPACNSETLVRVNSLENNSSQEEEEEEEDDEVYQVEEKGHFEEAVDFWGDQNADEVDIVKDTSLIESSIELQTSNSEPAIEEPSGFCAEEPSDFCVEEQSDFWAEEPSEFCPAVNSETVSDEQSESAVEEPSDSVINYQAIPEIVLETSSIQANMADTPAEQPQEINDVAEPQNAEPQVERTPPIVFKQELDPRHDFEELVGVVLELLNPQEQTHMEELRQYVVDDDGAWALSEDFGDIFGTILHDERIPDAARYYLTRIMAAAALKDDVILLLHQDRRDHSIMNFANKIERLSPQLQEAIALFFCNMFEHLSPSEWLLYISEWNIEGSQPISNIRVTTKVAVNALLHSDAKVVSYGTAIMYNLATKTVKTVIFDDVAPELAMAVMQYLSSPPQEELLWRTLTAVCRFSYASTEVPSLIKMIGPEPSTFRGASDRVDGIIEELEAKLSRVRMF